MNVNELKNKWQQEEDNAKIIEWEFTDFSVDKCFDNLLKVNDIINKKGEVEGTIHRFMIVAKK